MATATKSTRETLDELKERLAVLADLDGAAALLSWDQNTYMPPGGAELRAQQLATLSRLSHERLTGGEIGELLTRLEADPFPEGSDEAALLRLTRRDLDRATKLPGDFVERFSRHRSLTQQTWAEAREANSFSQYAPALERMLEYTLQYAEYLGYDNHPYDALHDLYEPGSTAARVKRVFEPLRDATVALLGEITEGGRDLSDAPVRGHFDEGKQEQFAIEVVKDFGYDFSRGRLDRTVHPFAQGTGRDDVRITTRYRRDFLNPALFGTMHEAGHAMYEQGISAEYNRSPLGEAVSLGVHESQSRLWENLVGRSQGFWEHAYPRLQEIFPQFRDVPREGFYAAINRVKPDFIRVEADEVTYNLHIMVRFELELALLEGSLEVEDLPDAWNAKYEDYLGITPPNDALGVLQDIHWSFGAFGYFPTYTLGNLMSVQLFEAAKRAEPGIESDIREGRFDKLLGWLRENVHRHGSKYLPDELLKRATGSGLDAEPYVHYLNEKFRTLYRLDSA